jgi:hypothetical protein
LTQKTSNDKRIEALHIGKEIFMSKKMQDLGYANGWGDKTPKLVISCQEKKHTIMHTNIGRCLNRFECYICKYFYLVDSSD